jgi:hypothetical protein
METIFEEAKKSSVQANLHLSHIEDLPVLKGSEGAQYSLDFLTSIYQSLISSSLEEVSVKWDGSPAIYFGDYPGRKEKVLALKSLFSSKPKLIFSKEDIIKYYSDKPDLVLKLKFVWKALNKDSSIVPPHEIWQGDLLFTPDSKRKMKGKTENYIVFHPNTILYAVKEDSELGKKIEKAEVGIVWHTRYRYKGKGESLEDLEVSYDIKEKDIKEVPHLWQISPFFKVKKDETFSKKSKEFEQLKAQALVLIHSLAKEEEAYLSTDPLIITQISSFINDQVKKENLVLNPERFKEDFKEYIEEKYSKRIENLKAKGEEEGKTPESQIKTLQKEKDKVLTFLENEQFEKALVIALKLQQIFVKMKTILIEELNKDVQIPDIKTFLVKKDGTLVPTGHEGYVLSDSSGKAGKLVDRLQFSRANFSPDFVKGWEREGE